MTSPHARGRSMRRVRRLGLIVFDCFVTCQVVCKITRRVAPNQAYRPPRPRRPASAERGCMPPNPLTGREVDRSLIQSLFDWIQVRVSSASSMDTRTTPPALTPDAPDRPRSHGTRRHSAHHLKTPRKVRQPKHCRRVDTIEHGGAYRTGDGPGLIHPRIRRRNPPQGRTGEASRKKRRGGLPMRRHSLLHSHRATSRRPQRPHPGDVILAASAPWNVPSLPHAVRHPHGRPVIAALCPAFPRRRSILTAPRTDAGSGRDPRPGDASRSRPHSRPRCPRHRRPGRP